MTLIRCNASYRAGNSSMRTHLGGIYYVFDGRYQRKPTLSANVRMLHCSVALTIQQKMELERKTAQGAPSHRPRDVGVTVLA